MDINSEKQNNDWKPVSELKQIEKDISDYGYDIEFIEVKEMNGSVFYREIGDLNNCEIPKVFETQYGRFNNHNNGEFPSWLEKEDDVVLMKKEREMQGFFSQDDYCIEGNFRDMFDCGQYSYAVSELHHLAGRWFKIVRIDQNLKTAVLYENIFLGEGTFLEYHGWFENEFGCIVVTSGFTILEDEKFRERIIIYNTTLFQISYDGNWSIAKTWEINIPGSNNIVLCGDCIYFGQNKMVTRLDINTGEFAYFTNKSDEELAALNNFRKL
ncbi:MAG: hypothetical protein ACOX3H_07920 [Saccharofermentanales bacterium]|jgi:hypothetical protein